MRQYRNVLYGILILGALAYTLWFVFAGFGNHQDPLYWLYKYETMQGGWMAAGTLLTGGLIVKLFGAQLLPLRLFGWLCVVAAILLPFFCLVPKEKRRDVYNWPILIVTFLLMGYGAFQEFSSGTLSVLLLSAIWVTAVTNHTSQILTAVLAGLAVTVRFPNILVLLILIPLWRKKCLLTIPVAALSAGAVYLLAYFFIIPAPLDAAMSSHDFVTMLTKLWTSGGKLAGYLLLSAGVVAILSYIIHYTSNTLKSDVLRASVALALGAAFVYFIVYTIKQQQWYNTDLTYLLFALIIAITVYSYIIHKTSNILIGVLLLSITSLGTDTGWLKLFPAVLCLLPVALCAYEKHWRDGLLIILLCLTTVTMWRMTTNSVGQSNLFHSSTRSSVAPYQGIAIRPVEQQFLNQYLADYDSLQSPISNLQSPILALGQEMHLMRAVTGCEAAKFNEFWSNIYDSVYTAKYRAIIQAEHPIVFCSYTPQFKTKKEYKDRESRMENMLREEGYEAIDRSKYRYMIYIPQCENE